jgi:hypothetical protein
MTDEAALLLAQRLVVERLEGHPGVEVPEPEGREVTALVAPESSPGGYREADQANDDNGEAHGYRGVGIPRKDLLNPGRATEK